MSERFKVVLGIINIILKDGKVLFLLRRNKFDAGLWSLPGGCVEALESAAPAAAREIKEETNLDVDPRDVRIVTAMYRNMPSWQAVELVGLVEKFGGEIQNREPDKSERLEWFPLNDLPENMSAYARQAIQNYKNGTLFSEIGF